jgi:hypothetical protein
MNRSPKKIKTLEDFFVYAIKNDKGFQKHCTQMLHGIISEATMKESTLIRALEMDIMKSKCRGQFESYTRWSILQHDNKGMAWKKKAIFSPDVDVRKSVFDDQASDIQFIQNGLDDPHVDVRVAAASSDQITEELVIKALSDTKKTVRLYAISNSAISNWENAVAIAMADRSEDVRISALKYSHCSRRAGLGTRAAVKIGIDDKSPTIRAWIAENSEVLTESQWCALAQDPIRLVRKAASEHRKAEKWSDPIRQLLRKAKAAKKKNPTNV